jgi:hypothetical protein
VRRLVPVALDRNWVVLDRTRQRLNFRIFAANTKTQKHTFFFLLFVRSKQKLK